MQVRVLYMGMLREIAGRERELVEVSESSRVSDLFAQLQQRVPRLQDFKGAIAVAVNYEYAAADAELREDDEVALLPPVSGGGVVRDVQPRLSSDHAMLVREPIDATALLSAIKQPEDGAVVTFDGIVRNHSRGRRTLYLDYSAYEEMALRQLEELAREAVQRFAIRDVRVAHRLGRLQIGETSVYIAVTSPHRAAAFEACRWIIDTLKTKVPIWKKEYFEDGAVWADGEAFPPEVPRAGQTASKQHE